MDQQTILRGFEVVGVCFYVVALRSALRERNPVFLGIFLACNTTIVWDWVFNCKWFFNVAWDARLIRLWTAQGEGETLAGGLAMVGFYYWVFHVLWNNQARLDAKLGNKQFMALYAGFMIYDLVFESLLIHGGLYRYHQADAFLAFGGPPWSNMIFNANLSVLSYLALRYAKQWGQLAAPIPFDRAHPDFWKAFWMPAAAICMAFWVCFVAQLFWYVLAQPWSAGPRAF
jgi:hypothetical protein